MSFKVEEIDVFSEASGHEFWILANLVSPDGFWGGVVSSDMERHFPGTQARYIAEPPPLGSILTHLARRGRTNGVIAHLGAATRDAPGFDVFALIDCLRALDGLTTPRGFRSISGVEPPRDVVILTPDIRPAVTHRGLGEFMHELQNMRSDVIVCTT